MRAWARRLWCRIAHRRSWYVYGVAGMTSDTRYEETGHYCRKCGTLHNKSRIEEPLLWKFSQQPPEQW